MYYCRYNLIATYWPKYIRLMYSLNMMLPRRTKGFSLQRKQLRSNAQLKDVDCPPMMTRLPHQLMWKIFHKFSMICQRWRSSMALQTRRGNQYIRRHQLQRMWKRRKLMLVLPSIFMLKGLWIQLHIIFVCTCCLCACMLGRFE